MLKFSNSKKNGGGQPLKLSNSSFSTILFGENLYNNHFDCKNGKVCDEVQYSLSEGEGRGDGSNITLNSQNDSEVVAKCDKNKVKPSLKFLNSQELIKKFLSLPRRDISSKAAFTLAEVLITLGIIGVVAAMTIPNLIANTKGQQYRTKLKKAMSTLSQAGLMSQARYGFDYAGTDTRCLDGATDNPEEVMSICAILNGTLTGHTYLGTVDNLYKNGLQSETLYSLNEYVAYSLADGTIVAFYKDVAACNAGFYNTACTGFIDINGVSLPNKEVSCTKGRTSMYDEFFCVVSNNPNNLTDIYPIWFHDATVEPRSNAAYYVIHGHVGIHSEPPPS